MKPNPSLKQLHRLDIKGKQGRQCRFKVTLRRFLANNVCLFLARQPPMGQGLLIHEVSRSHTASHHSR